MLTALGPLYGEGLVLSNEKRDQSSVSVIYSHEPTMFGNQFLASLRNKSGFLVIPPAPLPVAVLISPRPSAASNTPLWRLMV